MNVFQKEQGPLATWIACIILYVVAFILGGTIGGILQLAAFVFLVLAIVDTIKYYKNKPKNPKV